MLTYRLAEAIACAVVAVGLWELGRWVWWQWVVHRACQDYSTAFWAELRQRFEEADEMAHCPPAEGWDDEDCVS